MGKRGHRPQRQKLQGYMRSVGLGIMLAMLLALPVLAGCAGQRGAGYPQSGTLEGADLPNAPLRASIVATAQDQLGIAYKWGGCDPRTGYDCSGLIWYVYAVHNIELPRVSWQQYTAGRRLAAGETLLPGDLLFWRTQQTGKSLHVGIYVGGGQFIHAPKAGDVVRQSTMHARYWRQRFLGTRRVIAP